MSRTPGPKPPDPREAKLAAALRENLRRRKTPAAPTHPGDAADVDSSADPEPRR